MEYNYTINNKLINRDKNHIFVNRIIEFFIFVFNNILDLIVLGDEK